MVLQIRFGLEDNNVKVSYNQENSVQGKYLFENRNIGHLMQKDQQQTIRTMDSSPKRLVTKTLLKHPIFKIKN